MSQNPLSGQTFGRVAVVLLGVVALLVVMAVSIGAGVVIGSKSAESRQQSPHVQATATPRLVVLTPHILAAYVTSVNTTGPDYSGPTDFHVTTNGPFDILAACNAFAYPTGGYGSAPPITFTVVDANGHVADQVQLAICGSDPTKWGTYSKVVPEALPAGTYDIANISGPSVTLIVLDASGAS